MRWTSTLISRVSLSVSEKHGQRAHQGVNHIGLMVPEPSFVSQKSASYLSRLTSNTIYHASSFHQQSGELSEASCATRLIASEIGEC